MKIRLSELVLLLMVGGVSFHLHSAQHVNVDVKIIAEVYTPPCEINGGSDLSVNFNIIPVYDLSEGVNAKYSITKSVPVVCSYYEGIPYIRVIAGASGTDNVLNTNIDGFAIALYQGEGTNTPLQLGNGHLSSDGKYHGNKITAGLAEPNQQQSIFSFTAVPYKKTGASLDDGGGFTASATMRITYL